MNDRGDRRLLALFADRSQRIRQISHRMGHGRLFRLSATRPWTSDCVTNLHLNLGLAWPPEKTAEETRRDVQEVILMTAVLRKYGFERLYRGLLKKEMNQEICEEVRFLQHLGVTA